MGQVGEGGGSRRGEDTPEDASDVELQAGSIQKSEKKAERVRDDIGQGYGKKTRRSQLSFFPRRSSTLAVFGIGLTRFTVCAEGHQKSAEGRNEE